ncbi:Endonuclease-reverse transcriptase [Operophtera brumata]|uniref:Endonuclease-reverse transcriptase n=1 Tax=Operophtera brumata TaxID=104452 RepID=A0A0L7LC62_OPEBR|nr:Endonuclease-reverse transcriptase [Operophtera brumata]
MTTAKRTWVVQELENLKLSHKKQEERLDYLEKEIRIHNVVFFGISDDKKSYFELEEVILKIITEKLQVECDKTEVQHVRRSERRRRLSLESFTGKKKSTGTTEN